jgi:hypothetical protein
MNDTRRCRYVRVSNTRNPSFGLAFTHVSAFHAGTGVNLAFNKTVTASPAFRDPHLAVSVYSPRTGDIVTASGGEPLFWEVDLGGDEVPVGGLSFGGVPGYHNYDTEIQLLAEDTREVVWSRRVADSFLDGVTNWNPQVAGVLPWAIEYTHGPTITLHDVDGTSVVLNGFPNAALLLAATIGLGTMALVQGTTIDLPAGTAQLAGQIVTPGGAALATVQGLVPLTGANVVSSTPGSGTDREATKLFDKPGDPFLVGATGEFVYTVNVAVVPMSSRTFGSDARVFLNSLCPRARRMWTRCGTCTKSLDVPYSRISRSASAMIALCRHTPSVRK